MALSPKQIDHLKSVANGSAPGCSAGEIANAQSILDKNKITWKEKPKPKQQQGPFNHYGNLADIFSRPGSRQPKYSPDYPQMSDEEVHRKYEEIFGKPPPEMRKMYRTTCNGHMDFVSLMVIAALISKEITVTWTQGSSECFINNALKSEVHRVVNIFGDRSVAIKQAIVNAVGREIANHPEMKK